MEQVNGEERAASLPAEDLSDSIAGKRDELPTGAQNPCKRM